LKLEVLQWWKPWLISDVQIGGYFEKYYGITFATIRGAGHMAPQWRREAAYHIFSSFIRNTTF